MNEIKEFEVKKLCFETAKDVVVSVMSSRQVMAPDSIRIAKDILTLAIELEKFSREKKYWQVYSEVEAERESFTGKKVVK